MTIYVDKMPNSSLPPLTHGPLVIALLYDGLCTFEFGIAAEIFGLSRPEMGPDWYRFASCPIEPGPLRAHGGLVFQPSHDAELIDLADMIIVPGWKGAHVAVPESLIHILQRAHARGVRLVSLCSGAFVLAATGLLDGAFAATHWRYADILQARHPVVQVDATSLYHAHGKIFTSAGSAAGIDLLIDIVRQDFGIAAANSVARRLVVPAHRSGGQAQFLERPVTPRPNGEIAPLLDQIRTQLCHPWTTQQMAAHCKTSLRTFLRRFHQATGSTPGEWLIDERVAAAKTLLSETDASIEAIAAGSGFGSAQALRHHFRSKIGLTPTEYRSRFFGKNCAVLQQV